VKGIEYLGPLPADIQNETIFSAGLSRAAQNSNDAKSLVKFLTAPDAATVLTKSGLKPEPH
jgi:molybdate transport system substrate-binding protein